MLSFQATCFHVMLPFLGILQHYVKFNIRTIIMLEKCFGVRPFSGFIGHLNRCHAIFLVFLGGFGLLFMVWTIALTFLGC
jgi:hypothetical protein